MSARITGLDNVLRRLNSQVNRFPKRSKSGLREAALIVRGDSQKMTPVDTGNLKASAFTEVFSSSKGPSAVIGYTASYAPFVHERNLNYRTGQWKFLEEALKKNTRRIIEIIRRHVRIL